MSRLILEVTMLFIKQPLKNVSEAVNSRQKLEKKRGLDDAHFEPTFNAEMATQIVLQRFLKQFWRTALHIRQSLEVHIASEQFCRRQ